LGRSGSSRRPCSSLAPGGWGPPPFSISPPRGSGRIGVIDDDRVDITNFNRQVIHRSDAVGRWKTGLRGRGAAGVPDGPDGRRVPGGAHRGERRRAVPEIRRRRGRQRQLPDEVPVQRRGGGDRPAARARRVLRFGGQMLTVVPAAGHLLRVRDSRIPRGKDSPVRRGRYRRLPGRGRRPARGRPMEGDQPASGQPAPPPREKC